MNSTRALSAVALCALAAAVSSGCAATPAAPSTTATPTQPTTAAAAAAPRGSASVGTLTIADAYIPQPASPDVAAAYFTVTEHAGQGDVLLSASSVPASRATLMQESSSGADAETMTNLPHGLAIPPQTSVALGPGGYHLMLTDPAAPLTAGGTVVLTLRFQHAGTVTFRVPVTSLLSDALTSSAGASSAAGSNAMPGM